MLHRLSWTGLTVLACALLASAAIADEHEGTDAAGIASELEETESQSDGETESQSDGETSDGDPPETPAEYAAETRPLLSIVEPGEFSQPPSETAMEQWDDQNPWRYGTDYLFPLTRGLTDSGLVDFLQPVAMIFTVPFDVANLPLGGVAGLFGS